MTLFNNADINSMLFQGLKAQWVNAMREYDIWYVKTIKLQNCLHIIADHYANCQDRSGAGSSKLMMSFINVSLKFQTYRLHNAKDSHIFPTKLTVCLLM